MTYVNIFLNLNILVLDLLKVTGKIIMFIIEGTYKRKKLPKGECFILSSDYDTGEATLFGGPNDVEIKLKNNLVAVDVVSEEKATGGGIQGAAGGAVLGFLIAWPLGTAVGAGIGRNKKGRDNTILAISWKNGDFWVVEDVKSDELAALKTALATSPARKLTSKSHNSTKTKNKTKNKAYYISKIDIKKPKHPSKFIKLAKGKTWESTTSLPDIPFINDVTSVRGDDAAVKLFLIIFDVLLKKYNDYKWRHYDVKIETEKEVQIIAKEILKILIGLSNRVMQKKQDIKVLATEIKKYEDSVEDHKSKIKSKNAELKTAGFFSKGGVKRQIKTLEQSMKGVKSSLSKSKANLTRAKNYLKSSDEFRTLEKDELFVEFASLEKGNELFVQIFKNLFPNDKQPSKTLKHKSNHILVGWGYLGEFEKETYGQVFDEVWDKKIEDAIKALKDKENEQEKNKKNEQTASKDSKSSKKSQLLELKELLDDGLITKEEYEESRKKILGI